MLDELTEVHQFVLRNLSESGELMWNSSMPCRLPTDETIPLGALWQLALGRSKSVYRMGLGHRYGAAACRPSRVSTTTGHCPVSAAMNTLR
ncbi:hypothetical protein J4714_14340 [Staphylococcus epidermidis]|nr:hypothetical protein [Staphylococcus epidermidis]